MSMASAVYLQMEMMNYITVLYPGKWEWSQELHVSIFVNVALNSWMYVDYIF
ncbi:MAG: hypothetical protein V7718_00730 [Porticoccus sp.]